MTDQTQPVLFLPHGAPSFALQPGAAGAAVSSFAGSLRRPRAIVVISAHWCTDVATVGTASAPDTLHDFHGFARALYAIRYPAHGDRALGEHVAELLRQAGLDTSIDEQRGLDHGAWIPLRQMFPDADIPVVSLSLQPHRGTEHHLRLGAALAALPAQGILIVGSGNLTHNLNDYRPTSGEVPAPDYIRRFADWIWMQLQRGSSAALLRYRSLAPDAVRAHPSEEHLLPLLVALGAAGNDWRVERLYSGISDHALAMDSFAFWPRSKGEQA
ncbi:MAG: dioxygenase [Zoogloeaceae bacterium]|nr:dioxygenase [Zoogloeaceae bacterium]